MNHFKTFIFLIFLVAYTASPSVFAQLERPLRPHEIKALLKNIEQNPSNLKSRLFLGNHYYNADNWKNTILYLAPVAEKLPDAEVYKLANSYLNTGDFRQAEAIASILLSRDKVPTDSYLLVVEIYSKILNKTEKPAAVKNLQNQLFETLKMAQKSEPENPKIYDVWLEKLEKHIPHYAFEALRVMEDMKKNNIKFYPRHLSLKCKYNYLAKFTKETKLTCNQAKIVDPDNPSNYIYLGQSHVDSGDDKVGKRMLASVGKKFSKSEQALEAAADSYYDSGNISEAYKFYYKASLQKNATAEVYMGLARTAFELKKYKISLAAFRQHCFMTQKLDHEFRRASGLLKNQPHWQELFRQRMMDCKSHPKIGLKK